MQKKLREQAIRDPLTNVYNRRFFDETLIRELALAKRSSHSLSLMLIDIDHFKNINDEFGHEQGDRVLRVLRLLINQTRKSDVVCRYGGEEFIILLPNMEIEKAVIRANMFREEFRLLCLKNPVIKEGIHIINWFGLLSKTWRIGGGSGPKSGRCHVRS